MNAEAQASFDASGFQSSVGLGYTISGAQLTFPPDYGSSTGSIGSLPSGTAHLLERECSEPFNMA